MTRIRIHTQLCHELFSVAIEAILTGHKSFEFHGPWGGGIPETSSTSSIETAQGTVTDILIIDLLMDSDTVAAISTLKQQWRSLRVLCFLPSNSDDNSVLAFLNTHADGFVFDSVTAVMLINTLEILARGQSYLEPAITPLVLQELRKSRHPVRDSECSVELAERERMLLQLSADGLSTQRIAEVLYLQEKTVRNMWSNLFQKIGVSDRTQAVLWAIRSGYAELR